MSAAAAQFLNVDLELTSKDDLGPLVAKLGRKVVVIRSQRERAFHHVSLELYEFSRFSDAETCIAEFARLVRALSVSARRLWDGAAKRRFNIGIQAGARGRSFETRIKGPTLRRVSELGGDIVFTVYAPPAPGRRFSAGPRIP